MVRSGGVRWTGHVMTRRDQFEDVGVNKKIILRRSHFFNILNFLNGVTLSPLDTSATIWPTVPAPGVR
jgi:hypothetical protein